MDFLWDIFLDTVLDALKLVPFLAITFAILGLIEKKAGPKVNDILQKAGRLGPVMGGLLGILPQCGFSAAASSFYAGRVISVGTLFAVFLSTSDEMLPILISSQAPILLMVQLLCMKAAIGIAVGCVLDLFIKPKKAMMRRPSGSKNPYQCQNAYCSCQKGVIRSMLYHTGQVTAFIFLFTFLMEILLHYVSIESVSAFMGERLILGPVVASAIGLIPNCASSVMLTTLYLEGALGLGAMMAGLLTNAGVGVLVLFRVHNKKKECFAIMAGLYGIGAVAGILINLVLMIL